MYTSYLMFCMTWLIILSIFNFGYVFLLCLCSCIWHLYLNMHSSHNNLQFSVRCKLFFVTYCNRLFYLVTCTTNWVLHEYDTSLTENENMFAQCMYTVLIEFYCFLVKLTVTSIDTVCCCCWWNRQFCCSNIPFACAFLCIVFLACTKNICSVLPI